MVCGGHGWPERNPIRLSLIQFTIQRVAKKIEIPKQVAVLFKKSPDGFALCPCLCSRIKLIWECRTHIAFGHPFAEQTYGHPVQRMNFARSTGSEGGSQYASPIMTATAIVAFTDWNIDEPGIFPVQVIAVGGSGQWNCPNQLDIGFFVEFALNDVAIL